MSKVDRHFKAAKQSLDSAGHIIGDIETPKYSDIAELKAAARQAQQAAEELYFIAGLLDSKGSTA